VDRGGDKAAGRNPPYPLRGDTRIDVSHLQSDLLVQPRLPSGSGAKRARRALDQLDQQIAAALHINPRATWRQIAATVESTEDTVRRRAERLFASGFVHLTVISDDALPLVHVMLQFTCGPASAVDVAKALADRDDVRFVSLVTGPFDVVAEMVTASNRTLAHVLLQELPQIEGITGTTTETVVRNFKTGYEWSRDLLGSRAAMLVGQTRAVADPLASVLIEPVDLQLLACLQDNARSSFAELAARCGITESMARRRTEHLLGEAGVRPIALVDPYLLGYEVEFLLWLRVDLAQLEQVGNQLAARQEVRYVSATSGYRDLVCEVILRRHDDVYPFFTTVLGTLTGLRQVDVASELLTLKRSHLRFDGTLS
jgi:DNA-binding Lrp family transcriptional regulator